MEQNKIIQLTESGIATKNRDKILDDLIEIFKSIYGENAYVDIGTEDYNMLLALADIFNDMGMVANAVSNGMNLQTAMGFQLDNIASIFYNTTNRHSATYSTVLVTITGEPNTKIINGQIQDDIGGIWNLPNEVIIPTSGTINVTATHNVVGAYLIQPNQISGFGSIVTPVTGWTNVTNANASTVGENVESDSKFRYRLASASQSNSKAVLNSLYQNINAEFDGEDKVLHIMVWVNDTNDLKNYTDVSLSNIPAHSMVVSVSGNIVTDEDKQKVAKSILYYKSTGVGTYSPENVDTTITETISDTFFVNTSIQYTLATPTNIVTNVKLLPLTAITTITEDLREAIKNVVDDIINEKNIGTKIYTNELYVPIQNKINEISPNLFSIAEITFNENVTNVQFNYNQKPYSQTVSTTVQQ